MTARLFLIPLLVAVSMAGCDRRSSYTRPDSAVDRKGDEIMACGQLFHTGTRVVLWTDPYGYDAYRIEPRFPAELTPEALREWKYQPSLSPIRNNVSDIVKANVLARGWTLEELQSAVDIFVVHFDVCGTSRRCFRVLHDHRNLSVQFLLDVDGTIYQTMDLKDRAFHAKQVNDRSIGVEIAHIGAYPKRDDKIFSEWYTMDAKGPVLAFPAAAFVKGTGILTPDFVGRPARRDKVSGPIHGTTYWQYDFTDEQYRALAKLLATIHDVFPDIELEAPRGKDGKVLTRALGDAEIARFQGVLGHFHVTDQKTDPGPAFDWDRVLGEARKH